MVFLHGGAFVFDSGSAYSGAALSAATGVVVVSVNYRLGPLGFLAHPALDAALPVKSGNMGLRDQQLALAWVRQNIGSFGGDPRNVTLFGQSAGSISACLHLFAKGSENVADRIFLESGICLAALGAPFTREKIVQASTSMVNTLCPFGGDVVKCLQSKTADEILAATPLIAGASFDWWPSLDFDLLPVHPMTALRQGMFRHADLMIGVNANEFADNQVGKAVPVLANRAELAFWTYFFLPDVSAEVVAHYEPATDAEANAAFVKLMTDSWSRCPMRALGREHAARGNRVYYYSFEVPPAIHSQELDYVFGWDPPRVARRYSPPTPFDASFIGPVQSFVAAFAETGDPNAAGIPSWPRFERSTEGYLRIRKPLEISHRISDADCDFWDGIYERQLRARSDAPRP